ncbi:MAG: porin family protein [Sedimentisphaerales bacterium]|nr:porin family protein [Sedimentisphaerales bacterium]
MKRFLILSAVVAMVFVGTTSAAVRQGDTELEFLGGWLSENGASQGADFDAWFLTGGVGYFLNDNLQVQAVGMVAQTETDISSGLIDPGLEVDVDIYGLGGKARWHFMPSNQWVPYIGAQLLWVSIELDVNEDGEGVFTGSDDADGTMWGPVLGLRYELNENNDFFVEYQYHVWEGDVGDVLDDGNGLFVGIVHQFQ